MSDRRLEAYRYYAVVPDAFIGQKKTGTSMI